MKFNNEKVFLFSWFNKNYKVLFENDMHYIMSLKTLHKFNINDFESEIKLIFSYQDIDYFYEWVFGSNFIPIQKFLKNCKIKQHFDDTRLYYENKLVTINFLVGLYRTYYSAHLINRLYENTLVELKEELTNRLLYGPNNAIRYT